MDWLRKLTFRSPAEPERHVDILLAAERDAIIASHLDEPLAALGLVQIAPRRWVDGSAPPARRVFEIWLLKGAGMTACWGFSLDFVPHISGRRLCWHRSDRTVMLDVVVDSQKLPQACFLYGAEWLHRDLGRLAPVAIKRARETWQRGSTWPGMLHIVRDIRERKTNRFRFEHYSQLPLASIFLSAKTGDLATAQAELAAYRYWKGELPEDIKAKLSKLVQNMGGS